MFRGRKQRKAKKEAAKKAKAEQEAAGGVQLVRVAPKGTQYGQESPEYPLALRNPVLSRSMDALNSGPRPPPITLAPLDTSTDGKKKKKKKSTLRRAQSLAEDGMLAQSPQQRQRVHQPVYYYNDAAFTPMYVLADERGNGDVHPNTRPRYVLAYPQQHALDPAYLRSPQHSLDPAYLLSPQHSLEPPLLRSGPAAVHYQPQPHAFNQQLSHNGTTSPTTPRSTARSPSPGHAARHRNVHIIPKTEQTSKAAQKQRPVSQVVYPTSAPLRPNSTPLRSPSPIRSPSPAILHNTSPRKGKGKAIRVVEGWDEPDDEVPKVVQSHEVGVAPKSKVMDEFNSRSTSSPFSITISTDDKHASSVSPSSSPVQRREPTRKNKARPVSAAPWVDTGDGEYQQKAEPIQRQNGHVMVDFTK